MSTKIIVFAVVCIASAIAATSASAYTIRYQNWSQIPDNSAGVVFHPSNDSFEAWDNVRDRIRATVQRHHVYFLITAFGAPSYVSEFRTSGEEP